MFFNLHTHVVQRTDVVAILNQYPHEKVNNSVFFSIGIHPWHIDQSRAEADLKEVKKYVLDQNCVAIGECGLDKNRETPIDVQLEIFKMQLAIAQEYGKAVIVHCVGAFQELIAVKKEMNLTVPMVVHGFRKHAQLAEELLKHGFYLSFGKNLVHDPGYADTFANIPDDRFFLETDSAEIEIEEIYELAAKYKQIPEPELMEIISNNVKMVFGQII